MKKEMINTKWMRKIKNNKGKEEIKRKLEKIKKINKKEKRKRLVKLGIFKVKRIEEKERKLEKLLKSKELKINKENLELVINPYEKNKIIKINKNWIKSYRIKFKIKNNKIEKNKLEKINKEAILSSILRVKKRRRKWKALLKYKKDKENLKIVEGINWKIKRIKKLNINLQNKKEKEEDIMIIRERRSTWLRKRIKPSISGRNKIIKRKRRIYWNMNRNNFNKDIDYIKNYYKLYYNLIKNKEKLSKIKERPIYKYVKNSKEIKSFMWQGIMLIRYLRMHPPLVDHLIECLRYIPPGSTTQINNYSISNKKQLIIFLTNVWIGFFDYMNHCSNIKYRYNGIRFLLSGRLGIRKMERSRKAKFYYNTTKNSSSIMPLKYSSTQIQTRFGAFGLKIFVN